MATRKTATPAKTPEETPDMIQEAQEEEARDTLQAKQNEISKKDAIIEELKRQLEQAKKPAPGKPAESDYDRVHRIERECAAEGTDPWNVKVDVLAPHREKTEDPFYWLNVNGLSVQIPADDRYHSIKLPWACVLVDLLRYEKASLDFQDSLEVYDPETNPHR